MFDFQKCLFDLLPAKRGGTRQVFLSSTLHPGNVLECERQVESKLVINSDWFIISNFRNKNFSPSLINTDYLVRQLLAPTSEAGGSKEVL